MRVLLTAAAAVMLLPGCGSRSKPGLPRAPATIRLSSPAFKDGASIPRRFTCDGAGTSPPLRWSGVPAGARQLALVVQDRDAGNFLHWGLIGIRPGIRRIAAGARPAGAASLENGFGRRGWGGPCPPGGKGEHRYVFALYALRRPLPAADAGSAARALAAIGSRALGRGTLTGRYRR